jgi:hypothetical protein
LLLRIGRKRLTSAEGTVQEFCDAEFPDRASMRLDHAISTFRIEVRDLVQCHTEYYAGANLEPKGRPDFNLDGLAANVTCEPLTGWPFAATAAAHCVIHAKSDAEVRELAERLLAHLDQRTHDVRTSDMRNYLREVLAQGNREWTEFMGNPETKPGWTKLAGTTWLCGPITP